MDFSSFKSRLDSVDLGHEQHGICYYKRRLDTMSPYGYERPNRFFFEDRAWILRVLFLVALLLLVVAPVLIVMHPRLMIYHHQR